MKKIAGILLGTALLCGVGGAVTLPYDARATVSAKADVCANYCVETGAVNATEGLQTRAKSAYLIRLIWS